MGEETPTTKATGPAHPSPVVNHCARCGAIASFGFKVAIRRGEPGIWACGAHHREVEALAAAEATPAAPPAEDPSQFNLFAPPPAHAA